MVKWFKRLVDREKGGDVLCQEAMEQDQQDNDREPVGVVEDLVDREEVVWAVINLGQDPEENVSVRHVEQLSPINVESRVIIIPVQIVGQE